MPFGEFRGQALVNVPATKLIWYYYNYRNIDASLKKYIEDNMDVLKQQAKAAQKNYSR